MLSYIMLAEDIEKNATRELFFDVPHKSFNLRVTGYRSDVVQKSDYTDFSINEVDEYVFFEQLKTTINGCPSKSPMIKITFNVKTKKVLVKVGNDYIEPEDANERQKIVIGSMIHHFSGFINAINSREYIEGIEKRMIKTSKGKGKKCYSQVTFIHLAKRNSDRVSESKNINWDHSFIVRGHWRYFEDGNKLGKNRLGEYCEVGRTWVSEHRKLDHLDLIKKQRIVR